MASGARMEVFVCQTALAPAVQVSLAKTVATRPARTAALELANVDWMVPACVIRITKEMIARNHTTGMVRESAAIVTFDVQSTVSIPAMA
jgi:hypothetical protein